MKSPTSLEDTASSKDRARVDEQSRLSSAPHAKRALLLSFWSIVGFALFFVSCVFPILPTFFPQGLPVLLLYLWFVPLLVSLLASLGAITVSIIGARDWFKPRFRRGLALTGMIAAMVAFILSGGTTCWLVEGLYKLSQKAPS